jgi:hypothetical protein
MDHCGLVSTAVFFAFHRSMRIGLHQGLKSMAAKFKTSLSRLTYHQLALAGFVLHEPVDSTTGDINENQILQGLKSND